MLASGRISIAAAIILATLATQTTIARADSRRGDRSDARHFDRDRHGDRDHDRDRGGWDRDRGRGDRDHHRGTFRPTLPHRGVYAAPVIVQRPVYYVPQTYCYRPIVRVPAPVYYSPPVYRLPHRTYSGVGISLNFSFGR